MPLPIALDLRRESVLVVGGNDEASKRARGLAMEGAHVAVVWPTGTAELAGLAARRIVHWYVRPFSLDDARGYRLVFAAGVDEATARALHRARRRLGYWLCVVDDTERTDALGMAVARAGPVRIAVSSSATAPGLSRHLRSELEHLFDARFTRFAERIAAYRATLEPGERRPAMVEALSGLRIEGAVRYPPWEAESGRLAALVKGLGMAKSIGYGRRGARLGRPEPGGYFAVSNEFGTKPAGMDRRPERSTWPFPGPKTAGIRPRDLPI